MSDVHTPEDEPSLWPHCPNCDVPLGTESTYYVCGKCGNRWGQFRDTKLPWKEPSETEQ